MATQLSRPDTSAHDDAHGSQGRQPILQPGRNCWRLVHASRVAFLIDGAAYFAALRAALARARSSVFIIGWDVDSRTALPPGDGQFSDRVRAALRDPSPFTLILLAAALAAIAAGAHALRRWLKRNGSTLAEAR